MVVEVEVMVVNQSDCVGDKEREKTKKMKIEISQV